MQAENVQMLCQHTFLLVKSAGNVLKLMQLPENRFGNIAESILSDGLARITAHRGKGGPLR